ncbi:HipA domain-containing protein [Sphingomonas sp.]|uniref:HipA domain-containing protein n=1 Tax=Sphingomonas sp. TaxID=28214 RepID=UPI0038A73B3D
MAAAPNDPIGELAAVVDVSDWPASEDFGVFPVGSKPKRTLICPPDVGGPGLIQNHAYLFKLAEGWKGQQVWSEALAYQIGCAIGIDVPKCFIAENRTTGEVGALIEFFYGYPDEAPPCRLIPGADLLQERGFTKGADRPHNLLTNVGLCSDRGLAASVEWWAATVCFDALIGNTDRHTENWGLLIDFEGNEQFAPRFDNGTSLGFQQTEDKLDRLFENGVLDRFIDRGIGHLGWDAEHDEPLPLLELCSRFQDFENAGAVIRNVIQADLSILEAAVEACGRLEVEPSFSPRRADLVMNMIERRHARIRDVIGD